jgi:hypothetical protein
MNLSKKAHLADLNESIKQAAAKGGTERHRTLAALLECWRKKQSFLPFAPLLQDTTDRDVQFFVADAFAYANDEKVIKPLMKAAVSPANEGYRSTYIWPCGKYDCTKHLSFFVNFMVKCVDPGEAMLACVDVIEAMKGPFKSNNLKANVRRLLGQENRAVEADMRVQHELFRMQAAYALLDKYYSQVDEEWTVKRNQNL